MGTVPPPQPWTRGENEDYECITLEVLIARDSGGDVWSAHALQGPQDEEIALKWPAAGVEAASHGLIMEAIRRESVMLVLTKLQQDSEFLSEFQKSDKAVDEKISEALTKAMTGVFIDAVGKFGPLSLASAISEIRDRMTDVE